MLDDAQASLHEGATERLQWRRLPLAGNVEVVALDDRRQHAHRGAGTSNGTGYGERERLFTIQDRSQQRAPRQHDPQVVDTTLQRFERLACIGDDEQRVRYTAFLRRS